ncbi:MAG TPA: deoxyribonuclease V [Candidatus Nitrosotenuis sp.]|nr:deoxyribonuclease V [Candidatus Nitrosotenuis sp.]
MKIRKLHSWNVTPAEARAIQENLRAQVELLDRLPRLRRVAGCDVAFDLPRDRAFAGVIVYSFPEMRELERVWAAAPLEFPYVPGLLSFREAPALLAAFAKLRHAPQLIFCDAQGYAHPRRFGLACHLGVLLDCPTIGCAKSRLIGTHDEPGASAGSWAELRDAHEVIGAVLRTRAGVKPIFISQGHRVSLERAIQLTLAVCDGFRIPRPTREADHFVEQVKREHLRSRIVQRAR